MTPQPRDESRNPLIPTAAGLPVPYKSPPSKRDSAAVLCNLPCVLYLLLCDYQGNEPEVYLHVFESSEVPSNGAAPILPPVLLTPNSTYMMNLPPGCPMQAGVA